MQDISTHLNLILGNSQARDDEKNVVTGWSVIQNEAHPLISALDQNQPDTSPPQSVLDLYLDHEELQEREYDSPLTRLLHTTQKDLLMQLYHIIDSDRSNHVVEEEVADLIGYENIAFVGEILQRRAGMKQQLAEILASSPVLGVENTKVDDLTAASARRRMEVSMKAAASRPLTNGTLHHSAEILPHVYTSSAAQGNILSQYGTRYALPMGTVREMKEDYEEVTIPPSRPVPPRTHERLIPVSELEPLARHSFSGYKTLNRIQSIVFPTAYGSNENLLICAPTGAGKTDVAMLTILRVLSQHRKDARANDASQTGSSIDKNAFKIIYVAPMKALASEIVRKLGKRLQWLSIQVRELTGDMQMTKAEIAQTQIIVTTPEKWDVVTRKPTGEGELVASLKLLIIDEVHLLNEDRGAVIESIVARTLRQVESSQSMVRIVGLSATLPNYLDVAEFLSVSRYKGLFFFDSSFRPIPLEQHFIGIKGKPGSTQSRKNLDRVTFQKVSDLVAQGHQVMVFVHARKETVKTATGLREMALVEGNLDNFSCQDDPQWSLYRRSISESRNKEMKLLFDSGFGIHNAGMLRSDRNLMERLFESRVIKVLCCTATLAWGVNLPAHAVVIKGTQVYDSSKGAFVDLSVLDVLQVFGRAGRPGLETSGEGYICTTEDKLTHYLEAVTSQQPIESQFNKGLIDSLNAEISLGTVANVADAVRWLRYTYLFVRMRKNPHIYGISRDAVAEDPELHSKRYELIQAAARRLAVTGMIQHDEQTGALAITDLGRIAAKYYIQFVSIETFNKHFRPRMTEADALRVLSLSNEFDQIQVRESEMEELEKNLQGCPCDTGCIGNDDKVNITKEGKVNILLQGHISKTYVEDFALVSDMAYVAQNAGRIARALLEIAISRKWANASVVLMGLSKAIEKRLWPFEQPLRQFPLKQDIFYGLERWADDWAPAQLATLDASALGTLIHLNEIQGQALLNAAKEFPTFQLEYDLRPLSHNVLKISLRITRAFSWKAKTHGSVEYFWTWIEDDDGLKILQLSSLAMREPSKVLHVDFVVSIPDRPAAVVARIVSDRWAGAEDELRISLDGLTMPSTFQHHTSRLDLPFLPLTVTSRGRAERPPFENLNFFNALQTQCYWNIINTERNCLLCAPSGSGKTAMALLLAWMSTINLHKKAVVVIVPLRSQAEDFALNLRRSLQNHKVSVSLCQDLLATSTKQIVRVTTAEFLLQELLRRGADKLPEIDLVICDNLEQLNYQYELAVSLLRHGTQNFPTRFVGFSNSLENPMDLADWLGVDGGGLTSFQPKAREQVLNVVPKTFSIPQSAALMKTMVKPTHMAIQKHPESDAIVFVSTRNQAMTVASDLITQCALEERTHGYLLPQFQGLDQQFFSPFRNSSLAELASKGIGIFHEGMHIADRHFTLELSAEGILRVIVCTRESCWRIPQRAGVVVVMGTQYHTVTQGETERQLQDYDLTEIVQMQSKAVRQSGSGNFYLFCQSETKDTFTYFLNEGLPLESQLLENLAQGLVAPGFLGNHMTKQDVVDILSFTFLSRRVESNPAYYDQAPTHTLDEKISRIADEVVARQEKKGGVLDT